MSITAWLEDWNAEPNHWHNLDGYFKPIVTRFFITWFATAPLVASLIQKYSDIFKLPFDWWILWMASLAYAIAFALHTWKCPQFIKRYPTYLAYQARGHSPRWLVREFYGCWAGIDTNAREKLGKRMIDKNYANKSLENLELQKEPQVAEVGTAYQFFYDGNCYNIVIKENELEKTVIDIFWEIFGRWTASCTMARLAIWCLLAVAALLVLITVVQDIWYVVSLLWANT